MEKKSDDGKLNAFLGRIPTDIDVTKLIEKYGVPVEGTEIPYDEIETLIGTKRRSYRWSSVCKAWRKKLERDHNILLGAYNARCFKVLNPSKRVDTAGAKYKTGIKAIGRAVVIAEKTDVSKLGPEDRKICEHLQKTGSSIRIASVTAAKQLKYPE